MFVIHDSKADAFMQPWFLPTTAMAQRAFTDCVNDKEHNFAMHPQDYTLFAIGEYDDQSAKITWHAPVTLGNGIQYLQQELANEQNDLFDKTPGPSGTTNDSHRTKPNS